MENITESNARCQNEVLKVQNSDYNYLNWILPSIFMWKMKMTPGVFNIIFFQLLIGQNSKIRSVLKSSEWADFKTYLTFQIWWRFDGDIAKNKKIQKFPGPPFNSASHSFKIWIEYLFHFCYILLNLCTGYLFFGLLSV